MPQTGELVVCGIVSFGRGCGRKGFPGVYADVTQLSNWIETSMNRLCDGRQDVENCFPPTITTTCPKSCADFQCQNQCNLKFQDETNAMKSQITRLENRIRDLLEGPAYLEVPVLINLTILPIVLRQSSAAYDGKNFIYIVGGYGWINERGRNEHLNDIYRFSISTETIEKVGFFPQGISSGPALWDGSSVILFGGNPDDRSSNKIWKYSPGTKVAIEIGKVPYATGGSALVSHKPGEALLFGGDPTVEKILHYDKCGTVKELKDQRLKKGITSGSGAHYLTDESETVFLFGGCHKDIIHYDVGTGESYVLNETLPVPTFDPFTTCIGKFIYIFGGTGNSCEGGVSTGVVRFNPRNHELKNIPVDGFPNKIRHASGVFVKHKRRVYMFGGWYDRYYSNNIIRLQF